MLGRDGTGLVWALRQVHLHQYTSLSHPITSFCFPTHILSSDHLNPFPPSQKKLFFRSSSSFTNFKFFDVILFSLTQLNLRAEQKKINSNESSWVNFSLDLTSRLGLTKSHTCPYCPVNSHAVEHLPEHLNTLVHLSPYYLVQDLIETIYQPLLFIDYPDTYKSFNSRYTCKNNIQVNLP